MKKILKNLNVMLLVLAILLISMGCTKKEKIENEVVVGFDNTYFPMGYMNENGDTVGFDIDLAKETFKRLNMKVSFQPIDWSMKETELRAKNIDVIWNGYSLTEERKKIVTYTEPYMKNKQLIVVLKDSSIKNKRDLKGSIVGTQQGSAGLEAIQKDKKLLNSLSNKEPILYDTFDKVFRDLNSKRIDALVADETLAKYYINKTGKEKYNILDENLGEEDYVVAFSKDNIELCDKVNKILREIKKDKVFNEIYQKWFGQNN